RPKLTTCPTTTLSRSRRRERRPVGRDVSVIERTQRRCRNGRNRVEDAEQRVAIGTVLAQNQPVVVEIVARVHPNARGQAGAHRQDRKSTRLNSSHVSI